MIADVTLAAVFVYNLVEELKVDFHVGHIAATPLGLRYPWLTKGPGQGRGPRVTLITYNEAGRNERITTHACLSFCVRSTFAR